MELRSFGASLVAQGLKRLPAMRETWVRSLGREDPLEKEMATHSSSLIWENPMDGGAWRAPSVHGVAKSRTHWVLVTACGIRSATEGGSRPLHWERSLSRWATRAVPTVCLQ